MLRPAFIFTDHAVLQAGKTIPLWGECDRDCVTIAYIEYTSGKKVQVTATVENQRFFAELPPLKAGLHGELTFIAEDSHHHTSADCVSLSDVAIGEVWIAGGQSNMEHPTFCSEYTDGSIEANPEIRLFLVTRQTAVPSDSYGWFFEGVHSVDTPWQPCTISTALHFSAIGYFFAHKLSKDISVPIGIISCNWGGTPAESWIRHDFLLNEPLTRDAVLNYEAKEAALDMTVYWEEFAKREEARKKAVLAAGDSLEQIGWRGVAGYLRGGHTAFPFESYIGPRHAQKPSLLRQTMLERIVPYAVHGVLWHQGESNASGGYERYIKLLQLLFADWRNAFGDDRLPFYLVQIAAFGNEKGKNWCDIRKAQNDIVALDKYAHTVVSFDLGEPDNIHPAKKQPMGERLAAAVLDCEYHIKTPWKSPVISDVRRDDKLLYVEFDRAARLYTPGHVRVEGFALETPAGRLPVPADIEGNRIVIMLPVGTPYSALTYAWCNYCKANLYNECQLPVAPCRYEILSESF